MTSRMILSDSKQIAGLILATPRWVQRGDWLARALPWIAVFLVALAISLLEKDSLQNAIGVGFPAPNPRTVIDVVVRFIDTFVGGAGMTVLGVVAYAIARLTKNDALADAVIVYAAGGFWSLAWTGAGQFVLADARPRDGGAMHAFALHGHGVSGHASAASLVLSPAVEIFAREKTRFVRGVLFVAFAGWACFIGWSRIYLDMHHTWNVVLGLAIGFSCAHAAARAFEERVARGSSRTSSLEHHERRGS